MEDNSACFYIDGEDSRAGEINDEGRRGEKS